MRVGVGLGTTLAVVAFLVPSNRSATKILSTRVPQVPRTKVGLEATSPRLSLPRSQTVPTARGPEIDESVVNRIRSPLQEQLGDLQCQLEMFVAQQQAQSREQRHREQELFRRLAPQQTRQQFDRLEQQIALLKKKLDDRLMTSVVPPPIETEDVKPVLEISRSHDQPGRFSIVAREAALIDVLEKLGEFGDWEITATTEASTPVSVARLRNVTIEEALEVLLPAAGCAAKLDGNRLHVMSLAEARIERQRTNVDKRDVTIDVIILAANLTPESPLGLRHVIEEGGQVLMRAKTSGEREVPIATAAPVRLLDWGILNESVTSFLERLRIAADVRVVATPRIRVTEGNEASFDMGQRLSMSKSGRRAGRADCLEIGTRVVVRPEILRDGRIQLDIGPEQFSALIDKNKHWLHQASGTVSTRVLIPTGRTMVLSGLIQELPPTGDAPADEWFEDLLSVLGKSSTAEVDGPGRRELIMLVTPRTVRGTAVPRVPRQAAR